MESSIITTYGECRCCLKKGNHRHIMTEYLHNGVREVYAEMFLNCMNLFLLVDSRLPQLICSECITKLRDANIFRKLVTDSEQKLMKSIRDDVVLLEDYEESKIKAEIDLDTVKSETVSIGENQGNPVNKTCTQTIDKNSVVIFMNKSLSSTHLTNVTSPKINRKIELVTRQKIPETIVKPENGVVIFMNRSLSSTHLTNVTSPKINQKIELVTRQKTPETIVKPENGVVIFMNKSLSSTHLTNVTSPKINQKIELVTRQKTPETIVKPENDAIKTTLVRISKVPKESLPRQKVDSKTQVLKPTVKKGGNNTAVNISDYIQCLEKPLSQKQLDSNKLRHNTITILLHSTIVPFRNLTYYYCFYCEQYFSTFKELNAHQKSHENVSREAIRKALKLDLVNADISAIKCKICNAELKTIEDLMTHQNEEHDVSYMETKSEPPHGIVGFMMDTEELKCHLCGKQFGYFRTLRSHMAEHIGSFACEICGKKCLDQNRLKTHQRVHAPDKKRRTNSESYTDKKHLLKVKNEVSVKCPKCSQTFRKFQTGQRLEHLWSCHGIKKPVFKCDICEKICDTGRILSDHKRRIHGKGVEHICDICGYTTRLKTELRRHMDHHNGVKNYECDICKKRLRTYTSLKIHVSGHLNDKRFACSVCPAAFIQKHCLKNHIRSKHPDSGIDLNNIRPATSKLKLYKFGRIINKEK